ncbi:MAG: hypothetical protein H6Q17_1056 [Bacteroidetes bacterium]|jgi:hypothetical protein|nr:hypothetical protein [Bacteroidota bacterium]
MGLICIFGVENRQNVSKRALFHSKYINSFIICSNYENDNAIF